MNFYKKIPPERIVVACQCDIRERYLLEVEYLFKSLIKFGGSLSKAQKIVSFTSKPDNKTKKRLSDLGVIIRIVEPIDQRDVFATKIRNLEIEQMEHFDYLVSLDVDILIRGDFSSYIENQNIKAKSADMTPLTLKQWEFMFNYFGLEMPKIRYKTHFDLEETIPYFNTGVLLIPRKHLSILHDSWNKFVSELSGSETVVGSDLISIFSSETILGWIISSGEDAINPKIIAARTPTIIITPKGKFISSTC